MDPTTLQSDQHNDVHSLEHEESAQTDPMAGTPPAAPSAQANDITDATNVAKPVAANPFQHRSFIRRLWDRFNIYLLLFVLLIVLAVGSLVAMTIKEKNTVKVISSQDLSKETLQQLANTDVSVGSPKQVLTIQANSVFAGSALVRGDLDVAGTLKLGGDLSLDNLLVTGKSTLQDASVGNLTVANNLNVQGTLTLKDGISVGGKSSFTGGIVASSLTTGVLELNGDLKLNNHLVAGGPIPSIAKGTAVGSGGTVSLSGSDSSGTVAINTGGSPPAGCLATVTFTKAFAGVPHVLLTPVSSSAGALDFYVTRTTTTFSICSANEPGGGQNIGFDYFVTG